MSQGLLLPVERIMASRNKTDPLPRSSEFRGLGRGYSRFHWYSISVRDEPDQVLVTLPKTNWPEASKRVLLYSILWAALVGGGWLIDRRPLELRPILSLGGLVCLWPWYVPLLQAIVLRRSLPWIRFDKVQGVVHLLGNSRQAPIAEVAALCEVTYADSNEDGASVERYELQLMLEKQGEREFVLLSGSWARSAAREFAPVAARIAACLKISHLAVDLARGDVVERNAVADDGFARP